VSDFLSIPSVGGGELVVWSPDWSTYADSAAFNAAWTKTDTSGLMVWDLDGTHQETSTSPVPHISLVGLTLSTGDITTMSYVVSGLTPGRTYRYRYDAYSFGETYYTPNAWDPVTDFADIDVIADGSGQVTVPLTLRIAGGGTFATFQIWYDHIRLIDPNPPTLPIRCAIDQCSMTSKRTEDRQRAIDGTMMVLVGPTIRTWDVTTVPYDASDFNALLAALKSTPIVPLSGDWLGGSTVNVWPKLGTATPVAATAAPQALTFTAIEAI
jgi:hypothetical protein